MSIYIDAKIDSFTTEFNCLDESVKFDIVNTYLHYKGEDEIYRMEDFNNMCEGLNLDFYDVACAVRDGDFDESEDYVRWDGFYNSINSSDDVNSLFDYESEDDFWVWFFDTYTKEDMEHIGMDFDCIVRGFCDENDLDYYALVESDEWDDTYIITDDWDDIVEDYELEKYKIKEEED